MKIGLFFGSFNPIHIGHMLLANYFLEFSDLDKIWFVVSPQNPLKKTSELLDDYQRLYMVQLAVEGVEQRYDVSNIEFSLPKPSYTVHTLAYLKDKYPQHNFIILAGTDNMATINKWKNSEVLISSYEFYVYPRKGITSKNIDSRLKYTIFDAPEIDISSSFIRNAILAGKNIDFFLPPKVAKYIDEMNFYRKKRQL